MEDIKDLTNTNEKKLKKIIVTSVIMVGVFFPLKNLSNNSFDKISDSKINTGNAIYDTENFTNSAYGQSLKLSNQSSEAVLKKNMEQNVPENNLSKKIIEIDTKNWKEYQNKYYGFSLKNNFDKYQKLKSINGSNSTLWEYKYRFRKKEKTKQGFDILIFNKKKITEKDVVFNNQDYIFEKENREYLYAINSVEIEDELDYAEIKKIAESFQIIKIDRPPKKVLEKKKNNYSFLINLKIGGKTYVMVNPVYKKFVPPPTRSRPCFGNYRCNPDGDKPRWGSKSSKMHIDDCNPDWDEFPHPYCLYEKNNFWRIFGRDKRILQKASAFYKGQLSASELKKMRRSLKRKNK